jgi:hypothetical protein
MARLEFIPMFLKNTAESVLVDPLHRTSLLPESRFTSIYHNLLDFAQEKMQIPYEHNIQLDSLISNGYASYHAILYHIFPWRP